MYAWNPQKRFFPRVELEGGGVVKEQTISNLINGLHEIAFSKRWKLKKYLTYLTL